MEYEGVGEFTWCYMMQISSYETTFVEELYIQLE